MGRIPHFILIVLSGLVLSSCTHDQQTDKNIQLIDKYVRAVEANDIDAMASLLHEDYKGYGPSINDSLDKKQAIANWELLAEGHYEQIKYDDIENIAVTIERGPRKGDWVSNWSKLSIWFMDGRGPVMLYVNVVYKIVDGKIIQSRTIYNEADVLRQLGYSYY